jgi:hypothetical protein
MADGDNRAMYRSPKEIRATRCKWGWGVAAAGGSLILGIAAALQQQQCDPGVVTLVNYAGFTVISGGVCAALISLVYPRDSRSEDYSSRIASGDEIAKLLAFAQMHLEPVGMPTEQQLRDLLTANQELFYIVEGRDDDNPSTRKMVGCFTIIPLKQGAVRQLEDGSLQGAGIRPDNITKRKRTAKGFYVGIVIGADLYAKGFTLKHLEMEMDRLCKNGVMKVFTRPVTDDGLRLVRKQGFRNVINDGTPEMNVVCYKVWAGRRAR